MPIIRGIRGRRKVGTPFAFGLESEATPLTFLPSISDSEVFANTDLFAQCLQMRAENAKLKAENESLKAKVVAMQATNSAEQILEIRDLSREQAKEEVRAFFPGKLGRNGLLPEQLEFAEPLFHHTDAHPMVFADMAVFIMLVAVNSNQTCTISRDTPRGYPVLG